MRDVVFSGPEFSIVRVPGEQDRPVFITFDSFNDLLLPERNGFGEAFLARQGLRHITSSHLQRLVPISADARRTGRCAQAHRPRSAVITYGSSMGGYAAFRFSGLLQAARVIAFSPQYSVDPRRVPWETRWRKLGASLTMLWDDLPPAADAQVLVFYDSLSRDRRHARLMARERRVHHVRLPDSGHPCIALLQELKTARPHDPRHRCRPVRCRSVPGAGPREMRGVSPRYLSNRALRLPRLARRRRLELAQAAIALAPDEPWYRVAHGRLLAAYGDWPAAETCYAEAMAMLPDRAPMLWNTGAS